VGEGERPGHIFLLSAKSEKALRELALRYEDFLGEKEGASMADICFSANTGRAHFEHRLAVVAESTFELREQLGVFASGKPEARGKSSGLVSGHIQTNKRPNLAFLFTGQGSQYVDMGRELYETQPSFRQALERCDEILQSYLEYPLLSVLYPDLSRLSSSLTPTRSGERIINQTAYSQPALFALEYALAELLKSWGIEADFVMGHSVGEYVAACVAGVFSLEDGLKLVAERGRLMQALPSPSIGRGAGGEGGEMVAVFTDEARVAGAIRPYNQEVSIAAINGPQNVVISGKRSAVRRVVTELEATGIKTVKLSVSHAFHSPLMEPMLADFMEVLKEVTFFPPQRQVISNVTGELAGDTIATPEYWCRHVLSPVRFAAGMDRLSRTGAEVFVEIGPQATLLGMVRRLQKGQASPDKGDKATLLPTLRPKDSFQQLLTTLADLYVRGVAVDWAGFDRDYPRRKVVLPTYPFQRQRYWLETESSADEEERQQETTEVVTTITNQSFREQLEAAPAALRRTLLADYICAEMGQAIGLDSPLEIEAHERFFDLGFLDSIMAVELTERIESALECRFTSTLFFDYPTIEAMVDYLAKSFEDSEVLQDPLAPSEDGSTMQATDGASVSDWADVAQLSEAEAEALLLQELEKMND